MAVKINPNKEIIYQLDSSINKQVGENREKLFSILSSILFCATNNVAIRGKDDEKGNLQQLFNFRIEAGDTILKTHFETCAKNARYTSHQTQNDLINISGEVLRNDLVSAVNESPGFSILADETADISGTEQLSIGVRFVDQSSENVIREEFLGFTPLTGMSTSGISSSIITRCKEFGLNLERLLGQGYDGCSAMAGKENGVLAKIGLIYPKAAFVHCSAHRLNLVVNDLNAVSTIRNAIGTIKSIITYFRESPKRRPMTSNIPVLSKTRWTSKYKSIRIFAEHFEEMYNQLEKLSTMGTGSGQQTAHQLLCASSSPTFLFCLTIISYYSALLEPVTQALQAIQVDLLKVQQHIDKLLGVISEHRRVAEEHFRINVFVK